MDWARLENLRGVVDVKQLKTHLKLRLDQKGAPPLLDLKIYEDTQGRFQAVPSLVPVQKGMPPKPGMARPGVAQSARPAIAQSSMARPGMASRPSSKPVQSPSLAKFLEDERYSSAEEAIEGVVSTILRMSKRFPSLQWEANPAF